MNDQLTQCPHCQTSFRVTPGQIKVAAGLVRCGSCLGVFSAEINFIRVKSDQDFVQAVDDSDDILFADPLDAHPASPADYAVYEEYEESGDLLADLDLFASEPEAAGEPADDSGLSNAGADGYDEELVAEGLNEEFQPRRILFDDEEDFDHEDEDAVDSVSAPVLDELADMIRALNEDQSPALRSPLIDADLDAALAEADNDVDEEFDDQEFEDEDEEFDEDEVDYEDEDEDEDEDDDEDEDPAFQLTGERRDPGFGDADDDADAILEEYLSYSEAEVQVVPVARQAQGQQSPPPHKAALHEYLATLEDEDELEPLDEGLLDEFEEEPVLLGKGGRQRGPFATAALLLLCLLLIGTLLLQFVDQHLEALRQRSSFARFEPWFCRVLDCPPEAAPLAASSSLYSQELLIRSHPRIPGALELSFVFRNDAAEAQAFPGLELSFKDSNESLLANRLLLPQDYLPTELRLLDAMPGQSSVQVMLELVDPGAEAVNYTIAFRDL